VNVIEAHSLTRRFDGTTAVEDVSFEVGEGEVLGFLGPNGAGKTTTIRMLAGIIAPTSGYAAVAGQRTDGDVAALHEVIGLLTETPGFYEKLTARRNLEFYAGFYPNIDPTAQVDKYLKMMGLAERANSRVVTFSKGMKQRLALARALLHEPKVVFLDEPTAGLDPEAAHDVREMVRSLSREGRTIFLSTHNLTEAEELCQRIAVVKTRLLAIDTPANLRQGLFRRQVIVQLASPAAGLADELAKLPFVRSARADGTRLIVQLADPEHDRPELVRRIVTLGGEVMSVSEEAHSLEDVYLSLVHEDGK
jgi:ABC-2 type transport system ATP-binding protein